MHIIYFSDSNQENASQGVWPSEALVPEHGATSSLVELPPSLVGPLTAIKPPLSCSRALWEREPSGVDCRGLCSDHLERKRISVMGKSGEHFSANGSYP